MGREGGANQRISESANQRIGESANQRIGESANRRMANQAKCVTQHVIIFQVNNP
jgi:hypothetical protein